jgi:molybdopterin synthase catalytic subunit/molybdopterin converting factor small subunit
VNVTVRLFASYREAVGRAVVEVPLDDGADGQALWAALVMRYPALRSLPAPAGYAVNDEYVRSPRPFRESDEIAVIPPVSGGTSGARSLSTRPVAGPPIAIEITDRPISVDRLLASAADRRAGALVLFLGVVRDNARGRRVRHLTYEAYEALARRELQKIAEAILQRWTITRAAIVHRTGRLEVGETSVAIAVSAPHRAEAFEAARWAIDTLKQTVPIWKKEVWEGGEAWVGATPATQPEERRDITS